MAVETLLSQTQVIGKVSVKAEGELVDAIASKANLTKKDADVILSAALDVILNTVASGEKVTLVGFGTFEVRDRSAREGRNPSTGATIQIPATKVPAFSAGKLFKEKVAPAAAEAKPAASKKTKAK